MKRLLILICEVSVVFIFSTAVFVLIYGNNPWRLLHNYSMGVIRRPALLDQQAPELLGGTQWLNTSAPLRLSDLRGKVVLLDFWTYACINCQRSAPHVVSWYERYRNQGLVVIGVHTPEFRFERATENVQQAIDSLSISYPVVIDNDYALWRAYFNRYWPAKYLINKQGKVVARWFGEGRYQEIEEQIRQLLAE